MSELSLGIHWALIIGNSIGLPPLLKFASEPLKSRIIPQIFNNNKSICLCVSEPWTASDVANIRTTCLPDTLDPNYQLVNGAKKWITTGTWADYFTVAVRTGGEGHTGLSFVLLERGMEGLKTKHMKCSGVWPSGTAYITFENVRVHKDNIIGELNKGF